mgnify:CR=1 FL=1
MLQLSKEGWRERGTWREDGESGTYDEQDADGLGHEHDGVGFVLALEKALPCQQLVQDDTDREQIASMIDGA